MITSIHTWTEDEIETLIKGQIALIIRRVEAGHTQRAHDAAVHLGEWAAQHSVVSAQVAPVAEVGAA
jgi:hypothetical protein